jgi:hypothetical protein
VILTAPAYVKTSAGRSAAGKAQHQSSLSEHGAGLVPYRAALWYGIGLASPPRSEPCSASGDIIAVFVGVFVPAVICPF